MTVSEIPAHVSARHSYKKSRVNMLRDPARMLGSLIRMRIVHRGTAGGPEAPNAEKKTDQGLADRLVETKPTSNAANERTRTLQR